MEENQELYEAFINGYDEDDEEVGSNDDVEETVEDKPTETVEDETNEDGQEEVEEQDTDEEVAEDIPTETIDEFEVKFMGETKKLSRDEVIANAQKGMNYDRLKEKYESDPSIALVKELAENSGMEITDYIKAVKETAKENEIKRLMDEKEVSEEIAKELYDSRMQANKAKAVEKVNKDKAVREEKKNNELLEFAQSYPDIKPDEIPKEVWDKFEKGIPLKYAYMEHELNQIKLENKIKEKNKINKKQEVNITNTNVQIEKSKDEIDLAWEEDEW